MTDITLRQVKGAPLTYDELDANFANLKETADLAYDAVAGVGGKANAAALGTDDAALDMGSTTVEFLTPNGTAKEWIEELGDVIGLRSPWVYASRAEAQGANVPASVQTIGVLSGNRILNYVRDASGTALETNDGQTWSPADIWTYEHFGADGVDDTAAFVALHASIDGHVLELVESREYVVDVSTTRTWDKPFTLRANGATFRFDGATNGWAVTSTALIKGDHLDVTFTVTGDDRKTQRGFWFQAGCAFDSIKVEGEEADLYGQSHGNANAVRIAPLSDTGDYISAWVGKIETKNWINPVYIRRCKDSLFSFIKCDTYRRAVALIDVKDTVVNGGYVFGLSSESKGRAGENGILVEASEDYATENLRINNFTVEDSGEHGFRLGGQRIMRGVWHTSCKSIHPGSGTGPDPEPGGSDDHGGCGFKALGPTTVDGDFHEDIHYTDCSVIGVVLNAFTDRVNFAGMQLGKVAGCKVTGFSVLPDNFAGSGGTEAAYSCYNGIEIVGCREVDVLAPTIYLPYRSGIKIYDAEDDVTEFWDRNEAIRIIGGSIRGGATTVAAVEGQAFYKDTRRVSVDGLKIYNCPSALLVSESGGFAFLICSISAELWDLTSGDALVGATNWLANLRGDTMTLGTGNACRAGSTFQYYDGQNLSIRSQGGWGPVTTAMEFTIADDSVVSFNPGRANGIASISSTNSNTYGQVYFRRSGSPATGLVFGSSAFGTPTTGVLTGTTGTDTKLTVSQTSTLMYIENRVGVSITILVTI